MHAPFLTTYPPLISNTGMKIGALTALTSAVMDQENVDFPDGRLNAESWTMILFNLLFLGPFVYSCMNPFLTAKKHIVKTFCDIFNLVAVHSAVYALIHRCMHKIVAFRPIHKAHHQYKNVVLPSNANAVSANEFLFAYMLPFVTGCILIRPTSFALMSATLIVSGFNLVIHSNLATKFKWPWFLVTPSDHLEHHEFKTQTYSAPTFSWRKIFDALHQSCKKCNISCKRCKKC